MPATEWLRSHLQNCFTHGILRELESYTKSLDLLVAEGKQYLDLVKKVTFPGPAMAELLESDCFMSHIFDDVFSGTSEENLSRKAMLLKLRIVELHKCSEKTFGKPIVSEARDVRKSLLEFIYDTARTWRVPSQRHLDDMHLRSSTGDEGKREMAAQKAAKKQQPRDAVAAKAEARKAKVHRRAALARYVKQQSDLASGMRDEEQCFGTAGDFLPCLKEQGTRQVAEESIIPRGSKRRRQVAEASTIPHGSKRRQLERRPLSAWFNVVGHSSTPQKRQRPCRPFEGLPCEEPPTARRGRRMGGASYPGM